MQEAQAKEATPVVLKQHVLIERLTQMFRENGVQNPEAWEASLDKNLICQPITKLVVGYVNSQWRHWLGMAGIKFKCNTSDARYTLVDETTDVDVIVRLYKENVLPWILKHNLPTGLNS